MRRQLKYQLRFAKITILLAFLIMSFSMSYAVLTQEIVGDKTYSIQVGTLDFEIQGENNAIRLLDAYPMTDEEGKNLSPYVFSLTNTGTLPEFYKILLVEAEDQKQLCTGCEFLEPNKLKYAFSLKGETAEIKSIESITILETGTINPKVTNTYELRIWLNENVTVEDEHKYYYGKIQIEASQADYNEFSDESGANQPKITNGMIPVIYNEETKEWMKADIYQEWYNYNEQRWANAVTVTKDSREKYMNASPNTAISMNDINTMWVWIPRYEYQYTNLGTQYASGTKDLPGEISINFIKQSQLVPSDASIYKIPDGFSFGEENLAGFWMAKFETTGQITEACTSEECTTADLTVKPNLSSIRNQSISSFFYASRSMQNEANANKYGFDVAGTGTMDVHLLKNTEWGVVAYLSQSKYGKYGNPNYEGANKEVYQNKSSTYITGMSNGTPSTSIVDEQVPYDTQNIGYGASTTGNITGVYDMSGGALEYVMANYNNTIASSGFTILPNTEYYDSYTSDEATTINKSADATEETSGWYNDYFHFIDSTLPWAIRGGRNENDVAGVFSFGDNHDGSANVYSSVRLAIKP